MFRLRRTFVVALATVVALLMLTGLRPPAAQAACPCTVWPSSVTPSTPAYPDNAANELGLRFQSDQAGYVTALRFYKGAQNTGTHIGHLWTATGTLLATATYTNETASGWQQVDLSAPVAVTANTTYVVSYHTDTGWYAYTGAYFATGGATNGLGTPPLRALSDGEGGQGNGVYRYGGSQFPDLSWNAANYWVDLVFVNAAQDTTAPAVTARSPASGATDVAVTSPVTVTFDEAVQPSSIHLTLTGPGGAVAGTTGYDAATRTATFTPNSALAYSTTYNASVSGATDPAGNTMTSSGWTFTTGAPPPPPPPASGGPVLVVGATANPFGEYLPEILQTEGLNAFSSIDVSALNAAALAGKDVVLLGETTLTAAQVTALTDYVTAGGNLIAMRPDAKLAGLLGLTKVTGTRANGYLAVNPAVEGAAGITAETMQFHGTSDLYTLNGATKVATLYSNATTALANPAVTLRSVGTSGGQAAAFTFDLARSVVTTHQGNPAWAGQSRDDIFPIRAHELFRGVSATDWINLAKARIPQADEQQRLLTNLVQTMNRDRKPLPRLWYFPRGLKAVVIGTGDDHGGGGTQGRFQQYLANSPSGCTVSAWTCPRYTSYLFPDVPLTNAQATGFHNQGFEMGLHPDTGCDDFTNASLAATFSSQLTQWRNRFTSLPSPVSNRTHCMVWSNWLGEPKTELANGIRMDTNYYYWPPEWIQDRPGFMSGSGIPMRFAGTNGAVTNVFQTPTAMTDESGQSYPATIDTLLDSALGAQGYYGAFTANIHTDGDTAFENDEIMASAERHGVPIVSARQMLTWLDARNAATFGAVSYSARRLGFTVSVPVATSGLTAMIPTVSGDGRLATIQRDGAPVSFTTETIKGLEYAMFTAAPGTYAADYTAAARTAAPALSAPRAVTAQDGTPTVMWRSSTPASSEIVFGRGAKLNRRLTVASNERKHRLAVRAFRPGGTYRFRVRSRDAFGHVSVSPPRGAPPARFTARAAPAEDPVVTAVDGIALPDGTASFTWRTDREAAGTVEVGTTAAALDRRLPSGKPARRQQAGVGSLEAGRRLFYRVTARTPAGGVGRSAVRTLDVPAFGVADSRLAQWRMGTRSGVVAGREDDGELRLASGSSRGTYVSRTLDAQQVVAWRSLIVDADVPAGAQLQIEMRTGSTSGPDASWRPWTTVAAGALPSGSWAGSRYAQYRLTMVAGDAGAPVVRAIGITSTGKRPNHPTETRRR